MGPSSFPVWWFATTYPSVGDSKQTLSHATAPRLAAAVTIAFTPILIANLIFAQRFKSVGESVTAFGANLLGAMLGGILEYTSMITGYRMLLILVAVLYGLALLTGRTALRRLAAARLAA